MSHADTTESSPAPVSCTLDTGDLAAQAVEWSDLRPIILTAVALPTGARTTYALEHAEAVEDLAHREIGCCGSWLDIETTRTDVLTLTITTANPDGVGLVRALAGLGDS
jgi:hypothetical protein